MSTKLSVSKNVVFTRQFVYCVLKIEKRFLNITHSFPASTQCYARAFSFQHAGFLPDKSISMV